jgi:hypothetical protein
MWVLFNEGWGQFDAPRIATWVENYDPSRLVDHASGWADRGEYGDVRDIHLYPEPGVAPVYDQRAVILGEFGGFGWGVEGHEWRPEKGHGHEGKGDDEPDLTEPYLRLIRKLPPMKRLGLCGAVYTQIADQEIEVNGVMTYDREFLKLDAGQVAAQTRMLYETPPSVKCLLATSDVEPQLWRHTTAEPDESWFAPEFDDSSWAMAPGAFGDFHPTFPTLIVRPRTKWDSSDIWLRRKFELKNRDFVSPYLLIHHDESAEVYLNGNRILELGGASHYYTWIPMDEDMVKVLKQGSNLIAVHCHNEHHPQCIDVGMVDVVTNRQK